ncbi:carboxylesterase family protein [Pedobacter sp. HMF7647]|uniref:Carboxylic ester hydrolase n=1 Tax=Hufsiella arboris TaxID=2695275 RepID=A0A7K1Y717_9SPHI|nr:carboxylesterase family protein [Hufsiella arboris]MXV49909.1 carboxylesterase family protein [Hufsiella arboris]
MIKPLINTLIFSLGLFTCCAQKSPKISLANNLAQTANGTVQGAKEPSGVRSFKGIPFAAPPVGDFRWKEPQPAANWTGIRQADKFGPRAMQLPIFGDMNFRSNGMSEDCLYLNVWSPAKSAKEKLPVLVYFYGGGFAAGDGSEPRYDGESMATKGIVSVTVNYRLGVFGFLVYSGLSKESGHNGSGNYGLLDQYSALKWVQQNIAAFGGDPAKVTIAGESAGSIAVSGLMASPLSRHLFAQAIGESGSILGALPANSLSEEEKKGEKFASTAGAASLSELRAMPAEKILDAAGKSNVWFNPTVDNYFFPESPYKIYESGGQSKIPLLLGWNSEEGSAGNILAGQAPTPENYTAAIKKLYPEYASDILSQYPGMSTADILKSGRELASDRFIAHSTWKWYDEQLKTGKPVYRYYYMRPRPAMTAAMGNAKAGLAGGVVKDDKTPAAPPASGAVHSAEIEYALGNLPGNKVFAWTPDDYAVSKIMQDYFANFIKAGNPNGKGLPQWDASKKNSEKVMEIDVKTQQVTDETRVRYELLDKINKK